MCCLWRYPERLPVTEEVTFSGTNGSTSTCVSTCFSMSVSTCLSTCVSTCVSTRIIMSLSMCGCVSVIDVIGMVQMVWSTRLNLLHHPEECCEHVFVCTDSITCWCCTHEVIEIVSPSPNVLLSSCKFWLLSWVKEILLLVDDKHCLSSRVMLTDNFKSIFRLSYIHYHPILFLLSTSLFDLSQAGYDKGEKTSRQDK